MRRTGVVGLSLAIGALSVGAAGGIAGAASSTEPSGSSSEITPTFRTHLTEGLAWLAEGAEPAEAPEKSSSAAIRNSHEANDGEVSASKAHALAAKAVPALAGADPIVPRADQIARALGPNALQMEGKDGKPGGVVISDIPLAVPDPDAQDGGDWQPADLTFQAQGSRLVTARSLVPTSVPNGADGTFRVGPLGVRLAPEGSDSTATSYGTSVIHPNVATDTDLATRSVGAGLKFGWVLRSPDAAQTQRAKLDLPTGTHAALVDGGAVRIIDAKGDQVGTVSPAAAADADGISVPIETSLEGDTVSYRLKTDLAKLRTPVVIDPEMLYEWGVNGDTDVAGWVGAKNAAPFSWSMPVGNTNQNANGLIVDGVAGTGYAANAWGGWTHWAPGDETYGSLSQVSQQIVSPEHGFFWKAEFGGLNYTLTAPYTFQDPNVNIGVLSSTDTNHPPTQRYQKQNATGGWNAPVASNLRQIPAGTLGATYRVYVGTDSTTPPTGGSNAKSDAVFSATLYDFGLYGASNIARPKSQLRIGWTKLWAADNYDPAIANITSPTDWVKEDYALPVLATDRGTGIEKVEFYSQDAVPQLYGPGVAKTCVATGKILCPFTFNDTVPVAPLPEGIGTYDVRATDGGGRKAVKPATLKIDHSAPELTLSGDLFTQRDSTLSANETRALTVQTADGTLGGSAAQQRSGVQRIEVYVDDALVSAVDQPTAGDSRPLTTTWTPPAGTFKTGDYVVRVVAYDRLGQDKEAAFVVHAACCFVTLPEARLPLNGRLYDLGDVDGNGIVDVVMVDPSSGAIAVSLGAGDGTFASEESWGSFGTGISTFALGDIDGADANDDSPDSSMATVGDDDDIVARTTTGDLVARRSTRTAFETYPVPGSTPGLQTTWPSGRSLRLADVNGDGSTDLWGLDQATGELWVGHANGTGFDTATHWWTVPSTRTTALADFTGDGSVDLVTYDPTDGSVTVRASDGEQFGDSVAWGTGIADATFATGDIDGDGLDDGLFRVADTGQAATVKGRVSSKNDGAFRGSLRDLGPLSSQLSLLASDATGDVLEDPLGARVDGNDLVVQISASSVPNDEPDDTTPADPDPPGDEEGAQARATRPAAAAVLMMSDDNALRFGENVSGKQDALLEQMKYLGAERVRVIAWWGQIDRLHPNDAAGLALAPGQPETPTAAQTNPNARPAADAVRRFYLSRDADAYKPADAGLDVALRQRLREETESDLQPEYINGEWRIIEHRYYLGELRRTLGRIKLHGMSIHLTISGFAGDPARDPWGDCQGGRDPMQGTLAVRGCQTTDWANRTGSAPNPREFGHFVGELTQHLRWDFTDPAATPEHAQNQPGLGATLFSVGIWNEPNYTTFLSASDQLVSRKHNTASRYGQLYANAYSDLSGRSTSGTTLVNAVKVALGEYTGDDASFTDSKRKVTPQQYIEASVDEARAEWRRLTNPSGSLVPLRAYAVAVHPYQHDSGPSSPDKTSSLGVYGLGTTKGPRHSLKRVLSDLAPSSGTKKLLRTGTSNTAAPVIWATEFGYYTTGPTGDDQAPRNDFGDKGRRDKMHSESERRRWMVGNTDATGGALNRIVGTGGARVVGLWDVLEDPPEKTGFAPPGTTVGIRLPAIVTSEDYGFIGTGRDRTDSSWTAFGGTIYTGQLLRVKGTRPYGLVSGKAPPRPESGAGPSEYEAYEQDFVRWHSLQWPQARGVACAVKKIWAPTKKQTATWIPPGASQTQLLPAC